MRAPCCGTCAWRKDADEIALLRVAAHAADRVVAQIAAGRLIGRTEADVAREVQERLVAEGHDSAAFSIVASGPNSASPHHEPGDRVLRAGEPVVLDIGGRRWAVRLGHHADLLDRRRGRDDRAPPDFVRLYTVLRDAQAAATASVRPGIPAEAVDAVARDAITAAGFGPNFIHRTGHRIGLEGHEDPYLVAGNAEPLGVANAFSIEPGIYLEGRFGARIEDIVVCGGAGPDVLNEMSRELLVVRGRRIARQRRPTPSGIIARPVAVNDRHERAPDDDHHHAGAQPAEPARPAQPARPASADERERPGCAAGRR
ncbi:MAG: M24 family metallopeptidase [Chloroflexota bacterium]